jgi:diguanylate cyclase (GGDEF)-like protein
MTHIRRAWRRMVFRDARLLALVVVSTSVFAFECGAALARSRPHSSHDIWGGDYVLGVSGVLTLSSLAYAAWRISRLRWEGVRRNAAGRLIEQLAFEDPLTDLPNRRRFEDALRQALVNGQSAGHHALLLLDLNDFKTINDVYGHSTGDALIRVVARRLAAASRSDDVVARFGGDEFAILAKNLDGSGAARLAERIVEHFADPVVLPRVQHYVKTGIGIALFPFDGATAEEVIRRADIALYRAKDQPGSAVRCYDDAMDAEVRTREGLEIALRAAIQQKNIEVFYQPLVALRTGNIVGFEALARWTHPELGNVEPESFMSVAEDIGLIRDLTAQLLGTACEVANTWPPSVFLAFNISPVQLRDPHLAPQLLTILERHGLAPTRLEIEVTESALLHDVEATQTIIARLRAEGVRVALDDFGTGYSSLLLLQRLRPDTIKIDRRFVAPVQNHQESRAIIAGIITLGHALGMMVTAEGVETAAQRMHLMEHRCDRAQGFLFGRAMRAADVAALMAVLNVDRDSPEDNTAWVASVGSSRSNPS